MTKAKHTTPGPWFVDPQGAPTIRRADGTVISSVPSNYADACLIAAAPAMYEALKALHDWVLGYAQDDVPNARFHSTGGFEKMEAVRAALSKAEGS